MDSLRTGLIGAGAFGVNHAAKLANLPASRFVGLFDADGARAQTLAEKHRTKAFADAESMIAACDALIVASPAHTHAALAAQALRAGRHVLVEKPLATDGATAAELVRTAKQAGVVLQVGHQERFVLRALGVLDARERPRAIHAVREGPFAGRNMDVSVTFDLMIHDLDMAGLLAGAPCQLVAATGRAEKGSLLDAVEARLAYPGGVASLSASRVAPERRRTMRLEYASGVVDVDFLTRTIQSSAAVKLDPDFAAKVPDSLSDNVEAFLQSALGKAPCFIPGEAGAEAVRLAEEIDAAATKAP